MSKNARDSHMRVVGTVDVMAARREPSRNGSGGGRTMASRLFDLAARYAAALHEYLAGHDEAALVRAGELGRKALAAGFSVAELATVHSRALVGILPRVPDEK